MSVLTATQPILIVEDSDDDYEMTEGALRSEGNLHNPIYRCEDGEDALDFLLNRGAYSDPATAPRPGIVLLDLNMPGKDGRAVLAEMRTDADLKRIPVVILTTSDDEYDVSRCYELGANTYIKKPVDLEKFFGGVRRLKEYWFGIALLPKD